MDNRHDTIQKAVSVPSHLWILFLRAAKDVLGNWELGDLDLAVNRLREVLELVESQCVLAPARTARFRAHGRLVYKLAGAKETYLATATSRRLARRIAAGLNHAAVSIVPKRTAAETGIALKLALSAPDLAKAVRRLINCPALNLDDLEPEDIAALRESIRIYVRATGHNPADPE